MISEFMLNHTMGVTRRVQAKNQAGEYVASGDPVVILADVPCAIQSSLGSGSERPSERERGLQTTHKVYANTDLSGLVDGDLVTDDAGKTYHVKAVLDMGGRGEAWCAFVKDTSHT